MIPAVTFVNKYFGGLYCYGRLNNCVLKCLEHLGMLPPPLQIHLSAGELEQFQPLLGGGAQPIRSVLRALALTQMAQGVSVRPDRSRCPAYRPRDPEGWASL